MSQTRTTEILETVKSGDSICTIDFAHCEVHEAESFTASYKADVAGSANMDLLIVTPNTDIRAHFTYELDVEAETDIILYEAVTATAGTAVVAYNRDRNSTTAATVVVTHTPSAITEGTTLIRSFHLGSGKAFGGGDRAVHEFILKKNTKYLFRLNNVTASANYMAVKLDWYEH